MTTQHEDESKVNWSIRLVGDEAAQWDDLLYLLRRETRRRTLSKADIMRALVRLASDKNGPVWPVLVATLTHESNDAREGMTSRPDGQLRGGDS